jgi:hypothetical protein
MEFGSRSFLIARTGRWRPGILWEPLKIVNQTVNYEPLFPNYSNYFRMRQLRLWLLFRDRTRKDVLIDHIFSYWL